MLSSMQSVKFALILATLAGLLSGCMAPKAGTTTANAADLPPFVPGDAAKGQEVFKTSCANCHGQDGKGMLGSGSNLVKQSKWMQKQTDAMLLQFLQTGHQPPIDQTVKLTDEQRRDAITYLRTIQQK